MIKVGDTVPELTVRPDPAQLFFFSSATHNGHRIHYDHVWATEVEGYPGLVIQGPLQEAFIARMITNWCGGDGRITRFAVQNRGAAFVGDVIACGGTVTCVEERDGETVIDVEVYAKKVNGDILMPGTVSVRVRGGHGR